MGISSNPRLAGSSTLAGLYFLLLPFSCGGAWGQYLTRSEFTQPQTALTTKFRTGRTQHIEAFALPPAPVQQAARNVGPVAIPVIDANSALGSALASCDRPSERFEVPALPGARGEVRLDRCYRGRDHLVCSFTALLSEARSLLENYKPVVAANYPDLGNLEGVCRIKSDALAANLESAVDFSARFRALKSQYDARVSCAGSVQQSFRDVTLSDMAQAPDLLKSMIDTIEGDMKGASIIQAQVAGLAEKIDASQKAMKTIQKVHRTMCAKNLAAGADAEHHTAR
jgi:hypothetical protein